MKFFRIKPFVCLLATAAIALPAEFFTGQAARAVIGQETFTTQSSGTNPNTLGGVGAVALANNTLFVADSNRLGASPINNRIVIYQNVSQNISLRVSDPIDQIDGKPCMACRGTAEMVLGQPDLYKVEDVKLIPNNASMRQPTGVATDGRRLVVADTDNNRVLIWNSIPVSNNQPADLVLGQENFTANRAAVPPTASTLRGPQGVWIQNDRVFVADTSNNRVLIWNSFPTRNNQPADMVIGQPNFTTRVELDLVTLRVDPSDKNLLNPVSVTSDGQRMLVADLGFNRVMIWNTIPTRNEQPADLVLGQPDFTSATPNNSPKLCPATGTKDAQGNDTYPALCGATIEFPRYALSDGRRLFVADGGNDRVLVYNQLPIANGQKADVVLGQVSESANRASDAAFPLLRSSADQLRTPTALAWDGTNLFVADPFNRRVMVFSPHDQPLPYTAVRNAASLDVFATQTIGFSGTLRENDEVTIKVGDGANNTKEYKYKIVKDDNISRVLNTLSNAINSAPDKYVTASVVSDLSVLLLTARQGGESGNTVALETSVSPADAQIVLTTGGAKLVGGQDAAKVAPGAVISLVGENLSDQFAAITGREEQLPTELGNVQVYIDGIRAPLFLVSPGRINAQMPWQVRDRSSVSAYVRIRRNNGSVVTTMPIAVPIIQSNPGIFAGGGSDPRPAVAQHFSSRATGTVSVDGTPTKGNVVTVTIDGRDYTYTVKEGDTLASIRNELINLINTDDRVEASAAGVFTRIRLRSKVEGPDGNGLAYSAKANEGATVIMTATTPALCCANEAGALVTAENPALPGETIIIFATGLGPVLTGDEQVPLVSGRVYQGPVPNEPNEFVSSLAGGKTANVLYAGLRPGSIGVYELHLELNSDLPTNSATQVTIAQDVYVSNVVTFPLRNPSTGADGQ